MGLFLATTPIIIVVVGIVVLKKPTWIVSLIAAAYSAILAFTAFHTDAGTLLTTTGNGIYSALQTCFQLWSAFALLELMIRSTGMERMKVTISRLTTDKRVQIVLIAFCVGVFIEGATGSGAPAAILAPFLLGLGFDPVFAAAACLIGNGLPPCFGGAGVPTISGMAEILDRVSLDALVAMEGRFLCVGIFVVPVIMLVVLYGWKSLKGMWGYLLAIAVTMSVSMFLVSNFIGPEVADLVTGVVGAIASVVYIKLVGVEENEEYVNEVDYNVQSPLTTFKAFFPYLLTLIALPVVRFTVPMSILTMYGYPTWIGVVVHLVVLVSAFVMGCPEKFVKCEIEGLKKLVFVIIALCAMFTLSNICNTSGMMSEIAGAIVSVAGKAYPAAAVIVGAFGAFMTGSCLGSNRMFAPMHLEATTGLGINSVVSICGSSVGACAGNMICPNNVIAVNATLELKNAEGIVMARTVKAFICLVLVYIVLALLYTYVLFPNFGM